MKFKQANTKTIQMKLIKINMCLGRADPFGQC